MVGVSIKPAAAHTKIKVTLKENDLMAASTWTGELAEADKEYFVAPKVNYKFEKLRKTTQQVPLNVSFTVELDGKPAEEKTETLQVRSINDCPFGVSNEEETLNDENFIAGSAEIGWMFAAYVNENHPMLDKILQEALATKTVNAFLGYQRDDPAEVVKQVFAIWSALQKRGIQYSSTTTTPGGSDAVYSQFVRFLDQSITNTQANCVDGSVLFASLLRKISIEPFLVTVPGHMYVGFYLGAGKSQFVGLEPQLQTELTRKDAGVLLTSVADERVLGARGGADLIDDVNEFDLLVRAQTDLRVVAVGVGDHTPPDARIGLVGVAHERHQLIDGQIGVTCAPPRIKDRNVRAVRTADVLDAHLHLCTA